MGAIVFERRILTAGLRDEGRMDRQAQKGSDDLGIPPHFTGANANCVGIATGKQAGGSFSKFWDEPLTRRSQKEGSKNVDVLAIPREGVGGDFHKWSLGCYC